MSGTSLDGVDAVAIDLLPHFSFRTGVSLPIDASLRAELLALQQPDANEIQRSALAANRLTHIYASACQNLLEQTGLNCNEVKAIGCHGQTVRHRPDLGYTVQINNPALLAELSGITVVADFRSRDVAAGGQGAPLVPAFHAMLFSHADKNRAILNLGGMANLTFLPAGNSHDQPVFGFDVGPGNVLLDGWIGLQKNRPFDQDGLWAASGVSQQELLSKLLAHQYFSKPPPKSCGRDDFNLEWLRQQLDSLFLRPQDVQATLLELTVQSICIAVRGFLPPIDALYLCGGGAYNQTLVNRLDTRLPGIRIGLTEELGLAARWVEAAAFAWLAAQTLDGQPGNLPSVTGARGPRILGAIHPANPDCAFMLCSGKK